MTVQPDDNMKAEIDYDGAFERVWIDNDGTLRDYDKSLEIGCAPVVKQRDELLAEVERLETSLKAVQHAMKQGPWQQYNEAMEKVHQLTDEVTRLGRARDTESEVGTVLAREVKERDELLAEVKRLKELVDYSDGLCEDCGRNLFEDEPKESYLHNWWRCGSCLNAQFHKRVDRAEKAESLARELLTALKEIEWQFPTRGDHATCIECGEQRMRGHDHICEVGILILRATEQLGETT